MKIMMHFKEWEATQGGNVDVAHYEAFKAGWMAKPDKCEQGCLITKAVKEFSQGFHDE